MVKLFPRAARDEFVDLVCAGVGVVAVGGWVGQRFMGWPEVGVVARG